MDFTAVPDNGQRPAHLLFQSPQVGDDVLRVNIGIVRHQVKVQVQAPGFRADRDATDGGDAVAAIPGVQYGRLAAWRPGATHARVEHKARFVEEHEMGSALLSGTGDARELLRLPVQDGGLIAFAGHAARFLRRPAEPLTQEAADVVVMVADAEVAVDDLGDALRGPQFIGPTMGGSALREQGF